MGACSQKNSPLWRRRSEGLPVHGSSAYCLRAAKWQTDVGRADDRQGWHWISPLPHCPNQLSVQELKSLGKPGAYPSLFSDTLQDPRPLPVPVQYSYLVSPQSNSHLPPFWKREVGELCLPRPEQAGTLMAGG